MSYDVAIILGSRRDLEIVERSKMLTVLNDVGVSWRMSIVSAHRNLPELIELTKRCVEEGTSVFIGIAGMAAALPGTISSILGGSVPVLGVGLSSKILDGLDALLSEARMPPGRPVAFCGLDEAGLYNAAILACSILALKNERVRKQLRDVLEKNNKPCEIDVQTSAVEMP